MVIPDSQDFDYAVVVLSSIVKLCCWTTTMIVVVAACKEKKEQFKTKAVNGQFGEDFENFNKYSVKCFFWLVFQSFFFVVNLSYNFLGT